MTTWMSRASLLLATLLCGCGMDTSQPKRIVLITLDTLRLDAFEGRDGHSSAMPLTREWAEEARVFERSYASSSSTQPTHVTLLTGRHPWQHGITRNGLVLADETATIPERLRDSDYRTAAVVASFPLHRVFGFAQGFDLFVDDFQHDFGLRVWSGASVPRGKFYSTADFVTRRALEFLDESQGGNEFLWLHYFDPHAPYGATQTRSMEVDEIVRRVRRNPESTGSILARARELYHADIRFMDRELDRLLQRLKQAEDEYETHVFVTADHGESFGENGVLAHGSRLSEEQIHVPLVVRSPLVEPGIDSRPVGSIDVARAILSVAGLSAERTSTLLDPMNGGGGVFGMLEHSERTPAERRTDSQVIRPERRLFYLADGERIVTGNSNRIVDPTLDARDVQFLKRAFSGFERSLEGQSVEETLDDRAIEALRALGYFR